MTTCTRYPCGGTRHGCPMDDCPGRRDARALANLPQLQMSEGTELKRSEVLSFVEGLLTIKVAGHGKTNGWGEFAFHERQVDIDSDGYHKVEVMPSELRELRDFIARVLGSDK